MPKFKLTLNKYLQPAPILQYELFFLYCRVPEEDGNQRLPQHLIQIAANSSEPHGKDDRVRLFCHLHLPSTP